MGADGTGSPAPRGRRAAADRAPAVGNRVVGAASEGGGDWSGTDCPTDRHRLCLLLRLRATRARPQTATDSRHPQARRTRCRRRDAPWTRWWPALVAAAAAAGAAAVLRGAAAAVAGPSTHHRRSGGSRSRAARTGAGVGGGRRTRRSGAALCRGRTPASGAAPGARARWGGTAGCRRHRALRRRRRHTDHSLVTRRGAAGGGTHPEEEDARQRHRRSERNGTPRRATDHMCVRQRRDAARPRGSCPRERRAGGEREMGNVGGCSHPSRGRIVIIGSRRDEKKKRCSSSPRVSRTCRRRPSGSPG